jgi:methionyl-tRNA formyltransferase
MARVFFMGTPDFCLPSLGCLLENHELVGILTQPDRPQGRGLKMQPPAVKRFALEKGFSSDLIFQWEKLNTSEHLDHVKKLTADFIVVIAYGKILRASFLQLPKIACINIHGSLLPAFRGASPIQAALLAGASHTGVCSMQMAEQMDAGGVYLSASTGISPEDTAQSLHDRLSQMAVQILSDTLEGLKKKTLFALEQDEQKASYCQKLSRSSGYLTADQSAFELLCKIRAFDPWPGTSLGFDKKRLIVKAACLSSEEVPQGVLLVKDQRLFFGAKQSSLELLRVYWEGKKPVSLKEFICGLQKPSLKSD